MITGTTPTPGGLTAASHGPTPAASDGAGRRRRQRWLAGAATAAVIAPLVALFAALTGRSWVPIGDEAVVLFRIDQVGTPQTPLVGAYSTHGWAHPGPIGYYLLALPFRLLGGAPIDQFRAAVVVNIVVVGLLGYLAWRRRGLVGTVTAGAVVATLLVGVGPEQLSSPWNPYTPLLPYLAFMLCCWSVAERDWAMLPLAAGLGSVASQAHLGFLPLVAGAALVTAGLAWRPSRPAPPAPRPDRRVVVVTGAVLALSWLPALLDLADRGFDSNLSRLAQYFLEGEGDPVGFADGVGLLSGRVSPLGPWMGGAERGAFGEALPSTGWALLLVFGAVVLALLALVRSGRPPGVAVLALSQLAVATIAAARLEPPLNSYLLAWMQPLAAFCWMAVALSAAEVVGAWWHGRDHGRVPLRTVALVLVGAVLVVQATRAADAADPVGLPRTRRAAAVTSVVDQLVDDLPPGKVFRIEGVGDKLNGEWVGVVYGLDQAGVGFATADGRKGLKWGAEHVRDRQHPTDVTLTVATNGGDGQAVERCDRDPGVERVAEWDLLDAAERTRLRDLQFAAYLRRGEVPAAAQREREALAEDAYQLVVFAGDDLCGREG